jgi:hypothetical protein
MNIFELIQQNVPTVTKDVTSNIIRKSSSSVDPTVAARQLFLSKLQENIDGLQALTEGKDWPTKPPKKEGGRETKYAKWFALDATTNTYELQILYSRRNVKGILGFDNEGESIRFIKSIPQNVLPNCLTAIKQEVEKGTYDQYLLAAREAVGKAMRKKKDEAATVA